MGCDTLLGRVKREFDRTAPSMFSASRVRTVAQSQRSAELKRTRVSESVQMMFENEVAILDDGDEDRLAKRLFQYEVLSNTWGVAGCFDVTEQVGRESITSKYCHWQEAVEYFQMLHTKTAHLLDRYSEASVVMYLVKTEEEMRYHVWRLLISLVNFCYFGLCCRWASRTLSWSWRERGKQKNKINPRTAWMPTKTKIHRRLG